MPPGISIVGLGPGEARWITRAAWEVLERAPEIWLRTVRHPAVAGLPAGPARHSFDDLYETSGDFEAVYSAITRRVLELGARPQGVVYAVPGDPGVGEATVESIRAATTLPLTVVHGVSFVEPCLALIGRDALDGLVLADALELAARHHPAFPPDLPALIGQLHSRLLAADVKLTLMNQYPDEHPVVLLHGAGTEQPRVQRIALHELDHDHGIEALTALYVPPLPSASAFESFQETVAHLRAPDGCPWDREQTPLSLRPHLMEEAYEALHALDAQDPSALREELGDLMLQIVLQAQIATESGEFRMADVIAGIQGKILRRHPHVFGDLALSGVDQVLLNWERLKEAERAENGEGKGLLGGVPLGLPALAQAWEVQSRVARVGFDWPNLEGVLDKIIEELNEVQQAASPAARAAEVGDLLFAVVNYARWQGVDPEAALREANARFRRRFGVVEAEARAAGRALGDLRLAEMDSLWEAAKEQEEGHGET